MKILIFLFFITSGLITCAQKVVKLTIQQPPEFGFYVSKQDTTIIKGESVELGSDLVVFGGSDNYQFNWSPAATLDDSTILNPMATPIDSMVYFLTVTDDSGCSFTLNFRVNVKESTVSNYVLPNHEKLQAVLFPNPNDGRFKVKLNGAPAEDIELSIIDVSGKVLKKQSIRNFVGEHTEILDLKLTSGVYTLIVDSGINSLRRQFIIN